MNQLCKELSRDLDISFQTRVAKIEKIEKKWQIFDDKNIFLGEFDAGQPDAGIYKLYDPTDEVLCYILMPTNSTRKQVEPGKWAYESNSLGSLSCLKVQVQKQPEKKQK